jgi:integrase
VRLGWRAERIGPVEPSHFIFATFKPVGQFDGNKLVGIYMSGFDPTHPIGSWKKAWRKLTEKAGLKGLRFHDLRHHAITELAESGASDQTILSIAGHVSRRMLERYSHIRMEAKRNALAAISRTKVSHGTASGTKTGAEVENVPNLGIKMVGACGFEPQTPTVSR